MREDLTVPATAMPCFRVKEAGSYGSSDTRGLIRQHQF